MEIYQRRVDGHSRIGEDAGRMRKPDHIEHELWRAGMDAERREFYRLARARKLSEESTRRLVGEIDLIETGFT